jgi:hypothetical protein
MKLFSVLLLCSGALSFAAELSTVHSVYILSMSHGLDQFLANTLTNEHVFRVVTDPKNADAILTDHIGETLQAQLDTLLPNPEPVKPPPPAPPKAEKKDQLAGAPGATPMSDPNPKLPPPASSFSRSKGTVFLVDPKSHQVLWSAFEAPKGSDSKELDRTASDIVSRLKKDLNPPAKK